MANRELKNKAIKLRLRGASYSQIKEKLGISKSTLSGWLQDYPLSNKQIKALEGLIPKRIEKYKQTVKLRRENRFNEVYKITKQNIGKLSDREVMLAGLFLYWGEGYKTAPTTTAIANTDPAMIKFFLRWLKVIKAPTEKIKIKIHIYSDMNKDKSITFWKKELKLPDSCFGQVYVKKSKLAELSYKTGFGHGTCNVLIHNRDLNEYVLMALKYIRTELS